MYIMNHGENEKDVFNGGLTSKGREEVADIIKKIKNGQNPKNNRNLYFTDIVTSDLRCCVETAEIAADILNINIKKTPFYENVPKYFSEEDFKVKVIVSLLLRGHQANETKKEFYERVKMLLSSENINKIGNLYYSTEKNGIPSPLLLPNDTYYRTHLIVTDKSMINAIYRYYCSYNPELMALAEKEFFAQKYASLYKVDQACEQYRDKGPTLYLHTGTIRKCNYLDF